MKTHGLSSEEKVKSKKEFEEIYLSGFTILSSDKLLKAHYIVKYQARQEIKFGVAVSKKAGDAVWRNRLKRLIRVSYKLIKFDLINTCQQKKKSMKIIFSSNLLNQRNKKVIRLADILPGMSEIVRELSSSS